MAHNIRQVKLSDGRMAWACEVSFGPWRDSASTVQTRIMRTRARARHVADIGTEGDYPMTTLALRRLGVRSLLGA